MEKQKSNFVARILLSLILCGVIVFCAFQVSTEELTEPQKKVWKEVESKWEAMKAGDMNAHSFEGNFEWWSKMLQPRSGDALMANYENWLNIYLAVLLLHFTFGHGKEIFHPIAVNR
jgi:hypothetical protein